MEKRMFVDVNVIQIMPPNCANRDDTGSPKTCMYGGVRRARVSSQSWKRAMRTYFAERFNEKELGVRTTHIVEMIADRMIAIDGSIDREAAISDVAKALECGGIKVSVKEKKKKKDDIDAEQLPPVAQALFFIGDKQVENMAKLTLSGIYDKKTVIKALNDEHAVDIALFGRMVADDPTLNADASSQVAHCISTHRVDNEYDYYTAVDERSPENNAGAGMIGAVEYNTSTLYRYSTVAVHDLNRQLLENKDAVVKAVTEFVRAFILSMPTGKQNTFANRTVPYAVLIAVRNDQPVSLAPAFETPVPRSQTDGGYAAESVKRMIEYEKEVCLDFVSEPVLILGIGDGLESLVKASTLQQALDSLGESIRSEF